MERTVEEDLARLVQYWDGLGPDERRRVLTEAGCGPVTVGMAVTMSLDEMVRKLGMDIAGQIVEHMRTLIPE